jgi:endonuclease G, mitochondrial
MIKQFQFLLLLIGIAIHLFAQEQSPISHLELPAIGKQEVIVKHLGYTLSYNEKHEQANWVAYQLTAEKTKKRVARSNDFEPDAAVPTGSAREEDYKASGYDRGHLAPAADMEWSEQAMQESFLYSNMSPQVPGFNRGIWKHLEEQVRLWAIENKCLYVVTGPVLTEGLLKIGIDKVSVPRYYYKVLLDYTQPDLKGIGFILPNAASTLPLSAFAVPIDSVEKVTGINFFPALPKEDEKKIEKTLCIECWSWTSSTTHRSHQSKEGVQTVQCSGMTAEGKRCKRMITNPSGLCTQHEK